MGYEVPNIYGKPHVRGGVFQGFALIKHLEIDPPAQPEAPELPPATFAAMRSAALAGLSSFVAALPGSPWGAWFDVNANTPGGAIGRVADRACVQPGRPVSHRSRRAGHAASLAR